MEAEQGRASGSVHFHVRKQAWILASSDKDCLLLKTMRPVPKASHNKLKWKSSINRLTGKTDDSAP